MKEKSLKINIFYNVLLQVVTMVLPLILEPYVSRKLGRGGIGLHNYTYSIAQYFIILGSLGVALYGNRQIAYTRDNKKKMSENFWSIFFMKMGVTLISMGTYMAMFWKDGTYSTAFKLQTICIAASIFDISWLFMGLEEFKKTVTRSLLIKLSFLVTVFLFVKDSNDAFLYIFLNGIILLLSNLILWIYLPAVVKAPKLKNIKIKEHLKPTVTLFIPQMAIQVYVLLNKTLLGYMANMDEVGIYTQAEKIIKSGLHVVTAVGTAMMPRMSNIFAKGNIDLMKKYLNTSLVGMGLVSIGMGFGMAAVSNEFVPWFFGSKFAGAERLMIILSPIVVFMALSNIMGVQFLIPSNKTTEYTISVVVGAVVNLVLNLILIPQFKAVGACIATLAAELVVMIMQMVFIRDSIYWKKIIGSGIKYLIAGAGMYVCCRFIGIYTGTRVVTTMIQVLAGIGIYMCILLALKDEFIIKVLKKILNRPLRAFKGEKNDK